MSALPVQLWQSSTAWAAMWVQMKALGTVQSSRMSLTRGEPEESMTHALHGVVVSHADLAQHG